MIEVIHTLSRANPSNPAVTYANANLGDAARWLGQLAVNIVDYIDEDDVIQPFHWNPNVPTDWVFGTETPRLLINEFYVEYVNAKDDPDPTTKNPNKPYDMKVWVELHNPLLQPTVANELRYSACSRIRRPAHAAGTVTSR